MEGIDAALMCLIEAVETDDDDLWDYVRRVTADHGEPMRRVRAVYTSGELAPDDPEVSGRIIAVTSLVEQVFSFSEN